MQKILTVPSVAQKSEPYCLTGNHYVSLPKISLDGTINTMAFLSGELRALVEFKGKISPIFFAGGEKLCFMHTGYDCDFVPCFEAEGKLADCCLEYWAPENLHGFTAKFIIKAKADCEITLGFDAAVSEVCRSIFHPCKMEGKITFSRYDWTNTLICQLINGKSYGGFGISSPGAEIEASDREGMMSQAFELYSGEKKEILIHFAFGAETDGIGLHSMDMQRRGDAPLNEQRKVLMKRHTKLRSEKLERYANFNLNFCYYFSCGYTLDTDELCLITSKSTEYYVSSAFWSRDCFLWAFPSILRADISVAREVLLCGFTKYLKNIAIHALYIDGRVLYPGFELDELAAPVIALKKYVKVSGDTAILEDERIKNGLAYIKQVMLERYDEKEGLFSTELDSSDDPVDLKFNTYSNALCSIALDYMGESEFAEKIKTTILKKCTKKQNGEKVFVYSVQGKQKRLYDNPPGSLSLLAHYGFVERTDAVFRSTLEYIYSESNPYYYENGILFGSGCDHTPYPWAASLINRLHALGCAEKKTLTALEAVAENCPIACESFSLNDGTLNTGDAFATMAGFIADGIFAVFNK